MAFTPIIYTFGASKYLNSIFESMSILFDFSQNNMLVWLYRIGAVIGVLLIILKSFSSRGSDGSAGAIDWLYFVRLFFIMFVIIVPKTTVQINDVITKDTYTITKAPWALSIMGWLTSSIGVEITHMYEDSLGGAMNPINKYANNGMAFGSQYYNNLTQVGRFNSVNFDRYLDPFMNECFLPAATDNNTKFSGVKKSDFQTNNNYYNLISGMNSNYLKNRYVSTPADGSLTCEQLRDKVLSIWPVDAQNLIKVSGIGDNERSVNELDQDFIKSSTADQNSSLRQAMFINAMMDSVKVGAARYNNSAVADSIYMAQSQIQQATAWRQGSQFASMSTLWLHIVVECMIYSLWTFLTFLFIFPQGWSILGEYLKLLLWLQMFPILNAILNSIIAVYATSSSQALAMQYGGFTTANFYTIGNLNAGIVTTAGYLSTMIPVIAWMFTSKLGGSIAAASGFVSSFMSTAESSGKQEALGSMDLHRVSTGNVDVAGQEKSGEMTRTTVTPTGDITSVGDTSTIQSSGTKNQLTTSFDYQKAANDTLTNNNAQIQANIASASKVFNNAKGNLYSAQNGQGASNTNSSGFDLSSKDGFGKVISDVEATQKKYEAAVKAEAGIGVEGVGGIKTSVTASKAHTATQEAKQNYDNAIAKALKYTEDHKSGDNHQIQNMYSSLHQMQKMSSDNDSLTAQNQKIQSLVNSTGVNIKTNGDQAIHNSIKDDLMKQGKTALEADKAILDMQANNQGQFAKLVEQKGMQFVKGELGDNTNYTAQQLLSPEQFKKQQQQVANRYNQGGYGDNETKKAQDAINKAGNENETAYQNNEKDYMLKQAEQNEKVAPPPINSVQQNIIEGAPVVSITPPPK